MDIQAPRKLVVLSLFITVISITLFRDIKNLIDSSFFKEKYVLIIGILSAPENFDKRISLRKTWLKLTSDISAAYYFVVGENICGVHPLDRVSDHSCVENSLTLPDNVTSTTEFLTLKRRRFSRKPDPPASASCTGFGFRALTGITVKKLGVIGNVVENSRSDVRVKLVSSNSKNTLASVTISPGSVTNASEFVLKAIHPVSVRQNGEAQIVLEVLDRKRGNMLPDCEYVDWNTSPGAVSYMQMMQAGDRKPWPFRRSSCSYVVMSYAISDVNKVKTQVEGREQRKKDWRSTRTDLSMRLRNESAFYGDILFLNVVDVYRNLPKKLVKFFQRVVDTEYFHYILKTDDDSFVDILRVYQQLLNANKDLDDTIKSKMEEVPARGLVTSIRLSKFWWWSRFREFWRVQETGKWRDDGYRSAAYPSFPCGGGYVLSRGIVDYLSENSNNLRYFQGEDVSVGIWLSGMNTIQFKTRRAPRRSDPRSIQQSVVTAHGGGETAWTSLARDMSLNASKAVPDNCEWTCDNVREYDIPLCNKVQLSEAEMHDTWNEYIKNGYI